MNRGGPYLYKKTTLIFNFSLVHNSSFLNVNGSERVVNILLKSVNPNYNQLAYKKIVETNMVV